MDGVHDQRALHAYKTSNATVAALEFLHDESVRHVVHVGAPKFFREVSAKKSHRSQLRDQMRGKSGFFKMLVDDGHDLLVYKSAHRVADEDLLLAVQIIHPVKVHSLERHKTSGEKVS